MKILERVRQAGHLVTDVKNPRGDRIITIVWPDGWSRTVFRRGEDLQAVRAKVSRLSGRCRSLLEDSKIRLF